MEKKEWRFINDKRFLAECLIEALKKKCEAREF